jgi:hypothetical protein
VPMTDAPRTHTGSVTDTLSTGMLGLVSDDALETVSDLTWPLSVTTYGRMRHDPQLTAVVNAYALPIQSAPWAVDPAGCRDEVVQLVADDLGLPILGADTEPGAARRRGVRWSEHLRLALLHLVFGHMPFEQRYDILDGRARLAALSERMPQSIADIEVNSDGTLKGIKQHTAGAKLIAAKNLVWYVHSREGAAWQGRSMLRAAFGAWLLKHEVWRVHATSIRRFGMGVPSVEAPAGGTPGQVLEAQRLASAMRVGDQSGVGLPPGFKMALTGMTGSVPDAMTFIRYLDSQMAQMALVSVLNLDSSPNGSRALGETFVGLLVASQNSIGEQMANTATGLSVQIVDYNWGETEPAPRVVCGDAGSRPEVTAESIAALMGAGAVAADPALEAWVRDRWRLPQRDPDAPPPEVGPVRPVQAKRPARSIRAAAPGLRRNLTAVEAAARTDFAAVQQSWETALDRLVAAWSGITSTQRADLREQIAAAVDAGDIDALGALTVDAKVAADLLETTMADLAAQAAEQQAAEADAQGVTVEPGDADGDRLAMYAAAVAAIIGSGLANAAGRDALRRLTPGADGKAVARQVDEYLSGLSDAFLMDQLGGAMSAAQNEGRMATLRDGPEPEILQASEVLDLNTCDACQVNDGHRYDTISEAEADYSGGGYSACAGNLRCRGILIAVFDESTVDQAA